MSIDFSAYEFVIGHFHARIFRQHAIRGAESKRGRGKMKWKPDWPYIAGNLLTGLMAVAVAASINWKHVVDEYRKKDAK